MPPLTVLPLVPFSFISRFLTFISRFCVGRAARTCKTEKFELLHFETARCWTPTRAIAPASGGLVPVAAFRYRVWRASLLGDGSKVPISLFLLFVP